MKYKKSQAATEFLILLGILLFASVLFLGAIATIAEKAANNKEENAMKDFGRYLQDEFVTASQVNDGYIRELHLPAKIRGHEYAVSNTNESFRIISLRSDLEFFYEIPAVNGTLDKGYNKIVKKDGVVYIK